MKKILLIAAVAAMSLASCGGNAGRQADSAAQDSISESDAAQPVAAPALTVGEPGKVVDLEDDNALRPESKVQQLTVLDFNATWCGPCKQFAPVFDASAGKYADVRFISVDVDNNPLTAQAFAVEAVPTVVFIRPDGTTLRFVGTEDLLPAEKFEKLVNENI